MDTENYQALSQVYDELMEDVPYETWFRQICRDMEEYGISKPQRDAVDPLTSERNLVLDLGCGTGRLTEMLYGAGYDMIGVDASPEMLERAMERREQTGSQILYLQQDMRELELYSTVGTVVCVCDSLNYLLEERDLAKVFGLVHNYLYPGGLFLFDFNTDHKYREVIGDTTIAENREDCSFIWENYYDEESGINEYAVTLYLQEGELYRRYEELHYQKGYQAGQVQELLRNAGFELIRMEAAVEEEGLSAEDTVSQEVDSVLRYYVVAKCIKA